jgi:hypothetical protein
MIPIRSGAVGEVVADEAAEEVVGEAVISVLTSRFR